MRNNMTGYYGLMFIITCLLCGSLPATADTWVSNGDGSVSDYATGLIWQQKVDNNELSQIESIAYCSNLVLSGKSDWRLPNIKELMTIVDFRRQPTIDDRDFPLAPDALYWSSTSTIAYPDTHGFLVEFRRGVIDFYPKTHGALARCVR